MTFFSLVGKSYSLATLKAENLNAFVVRLKRVRRSDTSPRLEGRNPGYRRIALFNLLFSPVSSLQMFRVLLTRAFLAQSEVVSALSETVKARKSQERENNTARRCGKEALPYVNSFTVG